MHEFIPSAVTDWSVKNISTSLSGGFPENEAQVVTFPDSIPSRTNLNLGGIIDTNNRPIST